MFVNSDSSFPLNHASFPETPLDSILHPCIAGDRDRVVELIQAGALRGVDSHSYERSPLYSAVKDNNLPLAKHLLKYGASESVNKAYSWSQETPLQVAIKLQNCEMARLLLEHGAAATINNENYGKITALETALTHNNAILVRLLLQNGALPSLDAKNKSGLTLLHQLMTTVDRQKIAMLLKESPEVAEKLNIPDDYGVTAFQRAVRTGDVHFVRMLAAVIHEDVLTNDNAHFTTEDLHACTTEGEIEALKLIPLHKFAFPLTIAQNNCQVMIRMSDGRVLKLSNTDAVEARNYLMKAKFGQEWEDDGGRNVLTTYLSPGHFFLRLKCRDCNDNSGPYNQSIGFYPTGKFTEEALESFFPRVAKPLRYTTEVTTAAVNALPVAQSSRESIVQFITEVRNSYKQYVKPGLQLVLEQYGASSEEQWYENNSEVINSLKLQFFLSDSQAQESYKRIKKVSKSCREDKKEACLYRFSSANCVDFVQSVLSASGKSGKLMDYVTDAQMGYGHLRSPSLLYDFKAIEYAYIQSRGSIGYTLAGAGLSSHHFADAEELKMEDDTPTHPPALNTPTNLQNLVATVSLGLVLSKGLENLARSLKTAWIKNTGERISDKEATKFSSVTLGKLKRTSEKLFDLDCALIILRQLYSEDGVMMSKISKLQSKQVDLEFDLYDLKKDIKSIRPPKPVPTTKFFDLCKQNFATLNQNFLELSSSIDRLGIMMQQSQSFNRRRHKENFEMQKPNKGLARRSKLGQLQKNDSFVQSSKASKVSNSSNHQRQH
ncbi:MAG: ankyrin repeat domain-containing protein [Chlamydiales bacterium]|nr:ankyrin repeat domain-containing protein [Chlamydiales bacterium]